MSAASSQVKLRTGVARQIISPPKGIFLIGYGDRWRGNNGVRDELTATALALEAGEGRAVILACDLLAINEQTAARVQRQVAAPVLIGCSHTHSGPITYADQRSSRKNRAYVDSLVTKLAGAANQALGDLQEAALFWGEGQANIAVNRRERKPDGHIEIGVNPEGEVDRSLLALQVRAANGAPLVNLVNFACHNTVLGPSNLKVSADWAGAMRRGMEAAAGVPALFLQGTTGDLNPAHDWGEDDSVAVETLGGQVAQAVLAALDHVQAIQDGPLRIASKKIWLPLDAPAETPQPPPTYRRVLAGVAHVPQFLVDPILNQRYPWQTEIQAVEGAWAIPLELNFLQVGELGLATLGAEVFNQIGQAIKAASPLAHTLVASLVNGCIGYLPSEAEYALGGYEVDLASFFYRLPGKLAPGAAGRVLAAVEEIMVFSK